MPYYGPQVLPEVYNADWGQQLAKALMSKAEYDRQQRLDDQAAIEHGFIPKGAKSMPAPTSNSSTSTPSGADLARGFDGSSPDAVDEGFDEQYHPERGSGTWDEQLPTSIRTRDGFRMPTMPARPGSVASATTTAPDPAALAGAFDQTPTSREEASTATRAGQPSTPTLPAPVHPGAFDPTTRTFGGNPLQVATAAQHAGVVPQGGPSPAAPPQGGMPPGVSPGAFTMPTAPRYELASGDVYDPGALNPQARLEQQLKLAEAFGTMDLHQREGALATARANALAHPPTGVTYRIDANGDIIALPTKVPGVEDGTSPTAAPTVSPIATGVKAPTKPTPSEPLVQVIRNGQRVWVPRSQATGLDAPSPTQPLVVTVDPQGNRTYTPRDEAAGKSAPVPGGAGGGAKAQQNAALVGDMQTGLATMEALSPKVSGTKIAFAVAHPMIGNLALNTEEKQYITAARTFLAGVLHVESGARLSNEQWIIGATRYLPMPGDPESVKKQKIDNAWKAYYQRSGTTPPAAGNSGAGGATDPMLKKYGLTPPGDDE